jgi:uncharacterized membrane protein YiaA
MNRKLSYFTPYFWILFLGGIAIYNVGTWRALPSAIVSGMWIGVVISDWAWMWRPVKNKEDTP